MTEIFLFMKGSPNLRDFDKFEQPPVHLADKFATMIEMTAQTGKEYYTVFEDGTYHTHPQGIKYPSNVDMATGNKLGLPKLCIGRVPQKEVWCWNVPDYHEVEVFSAKGKSKLERCIHKVKAQNILRKCSADGRQGSNCYNPWAVCQSNVKQ